MMAAHARFTMKGSPSATCTTSIAACAAGADMTSATAAVATTPATAWKREGRGEERERRRHAIGRKPRGRARVRCCERLRKENVSRLSSTLARPDRGRVRPGSAPRALARDANTAAGGGVGSRYRVELELRVDRDSRASAPARGTARAREVRDAIRGVGKQTPPRELENRVPCRAGFNRVGTLSGGPDAETDRHSIDEDASSTRGRRRRDRGGVRGREPRARPRGPPSGYTGSGPVWRTRYAPSAARGRRRRGRRPWRPPRCCGERSCRSEPRRGRGAQSCRSERGRPWFPVCAVRMRNRDRARAAETLATPCTVGAGALIRARCSVRGRRSRGGSRFKPSTEGIGTGKQLERVRNFAIFSPRSREPRR